MISYPGSSSTPKKGTGLGGTLTSLELDVNFLRPWFRQCVTPLVGTKAAEALDKVLDPGKVADRVGKDVGEFWEQTRRFLTDKE
jgi:hypothetical protein